MTTAVDDDTMDLVRTLLADEAGIELLSATWSHPPTAGNVDALVVEAHGWSPSLHLRTLRWKTYLLGLDLSSGRPASSIDDPRERIRGTLEPLVGIQRRIGDAGRRIGFDRPLEAPGRLHLDDVAHIRVGRAALATYVDRIGGVADPLTRLCDLVRSTWGDTTGESRQIRVAGMGELGGATMIRDGLPFMSLTCDLSPGVRMMEGRLVIRNRTLPAAMRAAMIGRRLGDAIETGFRHMDGLRVAEVEDLEGSIGIDLKDQPVPIGAHPALLPWLGGSARLAKRTRMRRAADTRGEHA